MDEKQYLSKDGLKTFLDNLKVTFSSLSHTHTKDEITDFPDVSYEINTHNTSEDAHNDIRIGLSDIATRLATLADSDDETLDQISEIVEYAKDNRELIEQITTAKVSVSDIIDNLETNVDNQPLSAAQGVALKQMVDEINIPTYVSQLDNDVGYLTTSNIPTVLAVEEWSFGLEDGSTVTKSIVTTDSITNEELTFELEDGSVVTKRVVIE